MDANVIYAADFSASITSETDMSAELKGTTYLATPGPQGEVGPAGKDGKDGVQGIQGPKGDPGKDGLSAYEIAVKDGFSGSETEWLVSLRGAKGENGADGKDGAQGIQGLQGLQGIQGPKGDTGAVGPQGPQGIQGIPGSDGKDGAQGPVGPQGIQGETGPQGPAGKDGKDADTTQFATTAFVNTAVSQGNSATATKLVTARSIGLTGLIEGTAKFDGSGDISIATTSPMVFDNAGTHNALYRGKDITAYWDSGEMAKYIADGTFIGIYPGDYIVKSVTVDGTTYSNVKWIVGDLDYHLHRGDTETTDHHVLIFPKSPIGHAQMNTTNVTTGGYKGSKMWTTTIPLYVTAIQNAFGSTHILSHRELLTNSISTTIASYAGAGRVGCSDDWEWTSVLVNLFNENMVYGGGVLASSFFDVGECSPQISLMQLDKSTSFSRAGWCWLRSVSDSVNFCLSGGTGDAGAAGASNSDGSVRPYFLLH